MNKALEKWIKWNGQVDCPVSNSSRVEVRFRRDGVRTVTEIGKAETFAWRWDETNTDASDVIAYRVLPDPRPTA